MNKLIYIFLIIVTAQFVFSKPRNDNPNNAKNNRTILLDNNTPNSTSAFVKLQTRFDPNRVDTWFQNSGTFKWSTNGPATCDGDQELPQGPYRHQRKSSGAREHGLPVGRWNDTFFGVCRRNRGSGQSLRWWSGNVVWFR